VVELDEEERESPETAAPALIVAVLKPTGKETPLLEAQVAGSSPSGQQYPLVKQKLSLGQASSNITLVSVVRRRLNDRQHTAFRAT
jgi:hypothetical protein